MKIIATFTGISQHLGFIENTEYTLIMKKSLIQSNCKIESECGLVASYNSALHFLQNWTNIKVIK